MLAETRRIPPHNHPKPAKNVKETLDTLSFTCYHHGTRLGKGKHTMTTYGYARCSTNESKQDIDRQVRELKKHGAEIIFQEFEHGDTAVKNQLTLLFDQVKQGDTIITLAVDRLSRSTKQLCEIIEAVQAKGIRLEIIGSITIDCRHGDIDPMTEAFLKMAGVFAELELKMIRSRIKSGMANAKAKGKRIGRPRTTIDTIPEVFFRNYTRYKAGHINKVELAKITDLSRVTIDKYIQVVEAV